jgi:hypothetical protein
VAGKISQYGRSSTDDQHRTSQVASRIKAEREVIDVFCIVGSHYHFIACTLALFCRSPVAFIPTPPYSRAIDFDTTDAPHSMSFGARGTTGQYQHYQWQYEPFHSHPYARNNARLFDPKPKNSLDLPYSHENRPAHEHIRFIPREQKTSPHP